MKKRMKKTATRIVSMVLTALMFTSTFAFCMPAGAASPEKLTPEEAVEIYLANEDVWKMKLADPDAQEVIAGTWFDKGAYFFIDLDFDGVLELVYSHCEGSGRYSYNRYYKIDLESKNVVKLNTSELEKNSGFDYNLFSSPNIVGLYRNNSDGSMFYFCLDCTRLGSVAYGYHFGKVFLNNDYVHAEYVFCYTDDSGLRNGPAGETYAQYLDGERIDVTEEEYVYLQDAFFAEHTNLNLICNRSIDVDVFNSATRDEKKALLLDSYTAFSYDGYNSSESNADTAEDEEIKETNTPTQNTDSENNEGKAENGKPDVQVNVPIRIPSKKEVEEIVKNTVESVYNKIHNRITEYKEQRAAEKRITEDNFSKVPYYIANGGVETYKDIIDLYHNKQLTTHPYNDVDYEVTYDEATQKLGNVVKNAREVGVFEMGGNNYKAYRTYDNIIADNTPIYFFVQENGNIVCNPIILLDLTKIAYMIDGRNMSIGTARDEFVPAMNVQAVKMQSLDVLNELSSRLSEALGSIVGIYITGGTASLTDDLIDKAVSEALKKNDIIDYMNGAFKALSHIEMLTFYSLIARMDICELRVSSLEEKIANNNDFSLETAQEYYELCEEFMSMYEIVAAMNAYIMENSDYADISSTFENVLEGFGDGILGGVGDAIKAGYGYTTEAFKTQEWKNLYRKLYYGYKNMHLIKEGFSSMEEATNIIDTFSDVSEMIKIGREAGNASRLTSFDALGTAAIRMSNLIINAAQ